MDLLDTILRATKDYWFLITLVASVLLTTAYMVVFRVNPWDQQRSVKLRRDRVRFHNAVGYTLIEGGHFSDARDEFEESLKLSPEDQTALNGRYLANLFINIGSPVADPAIGFVIHRHITETDALKRDRQHRHIIEKYLGDLYMRIADTRQGTEYYRSALKHKPDYPDALYALGWHLYSGGQDDIEEMERMFRKLTECDPRGYRGFHGLGYALYMKAISEQDAVERSRLINEAAEQSGAAKTLYFSHLYIVMDFGEIARSVNPELSLFYHNYGKKLISDPVLSEVGDNPYPLINKLLMRDGEIGIDGKNEKLSWIAYQTALDYLAMERMFDDPQYAVEHRRLYDEAEGLDTSKTLQFIYTDQLAVLDLLLPAGQATDSGQAG
jgi:tetratricopeptide (TPR) repeat protein